MAKHDDLNLPKIIKIDRDDLRLLLMLTLEMQNQLQKSADRIADDLILQIVNERITEIANTIKRVDSLLYP